MALVVPRVGVADLAEHVLQLFGRKHEVEAGRVRRPHTHEQDSVGRQHLPGVAVNEDACALVHDDGQTVAVT